MNERKLHTTMFRTASFVVLLALAAGCTPPGKPDPKDRPALPSEIMAFEPLYATNCAGCHGAGGELGPAPPLNDPLFLAIIPDDELVRVIREGRPGTPMPAFSSDKGGSLTEQQISALAQELKVQWHSDEAQTDVAPPSYAQSKSEGVQSSPGNRQRGEQVFARACAGCHGPNGTGEGEGLVGGPIHVPAFLALISDQALRRIIITGRPDLGMPNFAETDGRPADFQPLTSVDIDDLVALLADWRAAGNVASSNP